MHFIAPSHLILQLFLYLRNFMQSDLHVIANIIKALFSFKFLLNKYNSLPVKPVDAINKFFECFL